MSKTIPLSRGLVAVVDDGDYESLSAHKWSAVPHGYCFYAMRSEGVRPHRRTVYMHRAILGAPRGVQVDHVDGDGLDNRRGNLRAATQSQNNLNRRIGKNNRSGYKGVLWFPRTGRWQAVIKVNRSRRHLGYFSTPKEAHEAYCAAAKELHGEFARTA